MQKYAAIFLSLFFLFPFSSYAEDINAGFVQGLWYSSETIFSGIPTRIYVALRNNTPHDLTGTVRFTDNGKRIGSSEVRALSGRLVETWIDWTPSEGEHAISASLSDATLHVIGGDAQNLDSTDILAEDVLTIDTDTDKDGVGNTLDADDDADGVSDIDEKNRGTNPLLKNPSPAPITEKAKITDAVDERISLAESTSTQSGAEARGLEQYVTDGVASTLLSNMTQKVETAKQSLDTYREERNTEKETVSTTTETRLGTYTDTATITRSKIEPKTSFLSSFISGIAGVFHAAWTFVLFLTSRALAFPALLELALLVGILYFFYRAARSVGRRPNN